MAHHDEKKYPTIGTLTLRFFDDSEGEVGVAIEEHKGISAFGDDVADAFIKIGEVLSLIAENPQDAESLLKMDSKDANNTPHRKHR